jgi:hypothetical protein
VVFAEFTEPAPNGRLLYFLYRLPVGMFRVNIQLDERAQFFSSFLIDHKNLFSQQLAASRR